jgi:hypothetical protein
MLDSSFAASGPYPWQLEQTVDAAGEFSTSAFTRFMPMLRRYIEALEAEVDPFDASVWESAPAFRTTSWTAAGHLIPARGHCAAVAMGEAIWILGGQLEDGPTDRVDLYHPDTRTIGRGPSLPSQRMECQAVAHGGIYVIGGVVNHLHSATVEMLADEQ